MKSSRDFSCLRTPHFFLSFFVGFFLLQMVNLDRTFCLFCLFVFSKKNLVWFKKKKNDDDDNDDNDLRCKTLLADEMLG